MPYLSLYRKYRPQTFADVVGQDHVVQTLQNALRYGHVANGYLFCGTRGVAKTTIARILSKCLNCIGPDGLSTSPQAEPCNACSQCRSIQAGQNVDVVEMDAASNRSVSDIAKLRESVQFGPMESRFKVYIVDEAHQLSSDAKDAFLKTLEEPPANVVFILATTEAHAIPITIASRCQQFDFRRGSIAQLAEQCRRVLKAEDVSMPDDAIGIVARSADGSYRDALSLLDQVLAYKRDGLTASDVAAALGTVESEVIDEALDAVASSDHAALFKLADGIYLEGKDVRQFLRAISDRVRDLVFARSGAATTRVSGSEGAAIKRLADEFAPDRLVRMLEILTDAERDLRHSDQHRLLLEMTLLKLAVSEGAVQSSTSPAREAEPKPRQTKPDRTPPKIERSEPAPTDRPNLVMTDSGQADIPRSTASADESEALAEPLAAPIDPGSALSRVRASWREIVNNIQVRMPAGVAVIRDATPTSVDGGVITLEFSQRANVVMMDKPARREAVEKVINRVLRVPEGTYRIRAIGAAEAPPVAAPDNPKSSALETDEPTPILDAVIAEFGGKIIEDE